MTWHEQNYPDPLLLQILNRLQGESEEVKQVLMHLLCRRMQERGLLELRGVASDPETGRILLYKDRNSGLIYEVADPQLPPGQELIAMEDLNALMDEEFCLN